MSVINYDDFAAMWTAATEAIIANEPLLTKLDCATGDGDHGVTMVRTIKAIKESIDSCASKNIKQAIGDAAWNAMSQDGGSTGPLFGSLLMGMSAGVDSDELDVAAVAKMFDEGLKSLAKQSKAGVGDKTMMDALIPAVEAINNAAAAGSAIGAALQLGADAAAAGAESTKDIEARFGRARNIGERSLGHADPGATSISFIFQAFADSVKG